MGNIKKAMLGLVVVIPCVFAASPVAAAQPTWEECASFAEGSFENSKCNKGTGGGFEWVAVATATEATAEGTLEFEDSKTSLGAVRISCKVSGTGKIGPESSDSIEKMVASSCKVVKGTCGSPTVEAVHLPWATELSEPSGAVRDNFKSSGAGLPGWKTTCTVIIKVTDTCEGEMSAAMTNNVTEGLVEAIFDKVSPKAACSQSKESTGSVEGTLKIVAKQAIRVGGFIEFGPKPPPGKVPVEPNVLKVTIKNRSEKIELALGLNNTKALPFKLKGTTCGAKLAALAHCEDEVTVEKGTAPKTKGELVVRANGVERASYPLESE
jgi:hypothetical protein